MTQRRRVSQWLFVGVLLGTLTGCASTNYLLPSADQNLPNNMAGYQQSVETDARSLTAMLNDTIRTQETVVANDPGYANGYMRLAGLFLQAGDPQSALSVLKIACQKAPRDANDWVVLGQAQAQYGTARAADAAYRRALAINPGNWTAWDGLGFLAVSQNNLAAAWQDGATALRAGGEEGPTADLFGRVLYHEGDPADALQYYSQAQNLESNWWQSYYDAAEADLALGNEHDAANNLARAQQLNPESGPAWLLRHQLSQAERTMNGASHHSSGAS